MRKTHLTVTLLVSFAAVTALAQDADPVADRWAAYLPPHGSPASPLGLWRGTITRDGASQIIEVEITAEGDGLRASCEVADWYGWPAFDLPAPTFEDIGNGLRMDIFAVAAQVFGYQSEHGSLPSSLEEALSEPEAAVGLTYTAGADGVFEISGERAGQVVVYTSTQPLRQFVAEARAAVRRETGS